MFRARELPRRSKCCSHETKSSMLRGMIPLFHEPLSLIGVAMASAAGSLHCAGMCGGFVPLYAMRAGHAGHLAYSLGRLTTYSVLAVCAGALGATIDSLGRTLHVHDLAALLVSTTLIATGLAGLFGISTVQRYLGRIPFRLGTMLGRRAVPAAGHPLGKAFAVGLTTTLLPCGWLYAFVAFAAGTGSMRGAFFVMLAFWAGTLPAMLSVGVLSRAVLAPVGRYVPRALAVVGIVMGSISLAEHLEPAARGQSSTSCHDHTVK